MYDEVWEKFDFMGMLERVVSIRIDGDFRFFRSFVVSMEGCFFVLEVMADMIKSWSFRIEERFVEAWR